MFRYYLLCIFISAAADGNLPTVLISTGLIEGEYIQSTVINKSYYSFRGIPYAEPPIGELRFKPPVKRKPWTDTFMTKKDGAQCVQKSGGSEDCLFLNVYSPSLSASAEDANLYPVMVFIHGGGFVIGSSNSSNYGPEYLINKNVVLVTINYRLNIFGFLNSMDESAPGNVGLKDQIAALEWVQENIVKFDGDRNRVTIFGHSAGSASVQYLMQSNLAEGLFQRGIMQSGSSLNNWAFENDPLDVIHKLGEVLNIDSENITEFINNLQALPKDKLLNASVDDKLLDSKHRMIRSRFIPSVEYSSPNSFMTENSYSILSNNKVSSKTIMIGYVSNEALFLADGDLEIFAKDPTLLVPKALNILNDSDSMKQVWDQISDYYFNDSFVTNRNLFARYESDETFVRGIRKCTEFLRKESNVYFYSFDFNDENDNSGVSHGGELKYLFYPRKGLNSTEDEEIREKMTTLWTNFAKTGNPTPKEDINLENVIWPIVKHSESNSLKYLYIGKQLQIEENPEKEKFEFWEQVFSKFGKPPFYIY